MSEAKSAPGELFKPARFYPPHDLRLLGILSHNSLRPDAGKPGRVGKRKGAERIIRKPHDRAARPAGRAMIASWRWPGLDASAAARQICAAALASAQVAVATTLFDIVKTFEHASSRSGQRDRQHRSHPARQAPERSSEMAGAGLSRAARSGLIEAVGMRLLHAATDKPFPSSTELWPELGDDGVREAAYRGG